MKVKINTKPMKLPFAPLFLLAFASLLSACVSDQPDLYYSLRPELDPTPQVQKTPTAIRYTDLPPYYKREYFAYYGVGQQIIINKKHHWVFPFEDNFRDALRQSLANLTNNSRIYTYPLGDNIRPEVLIDIQIRELIADVENHTFRVSAQWQNSKRGEKNPEAHRLDTTLPMENGEPETIAKMTKIAVQTLAKAIAETL